jgi:hypothetical protein
MINCRNCINWIDESLQQIEQDHCAHSHIYMGCRIFGFVEGNAILDSCAHYVVSENLFTICSTCHITVPKVCVSLGECVNCTDTDLFCVDHCLGGDSRKYCTHFVRLRTEGVHLINDNVVFDLFPILGMPGQETPGRKAVESLADETKPAKETRKATPKKDS